MQVNKVNFIRWFDALGDPGLPAVPYAYWRNRYGCDYRPICLPGESQSFYINSKDGFIFQDFGDLILQMITDNGALLANDIGELKQHFLPDSPELRYNIYCEYVIPLVKDGTCRLRIVNAGTGEIILTSSAMVVRNDQQRLYETTTYCRFRHDRFFYNIRYHDLPAFYQQIRLGISVSEEQVEGENEIYKEVTTGRVNILESVEDKSVKFESYYFDREAHDACAIMIKHSFLELNGSLYRFKTGYKRQPQTLSKLSKGEFELYDQSFASINRC